MPTPMTPQQYLNRMQALARERNGTCLSPRYKNAQTKLRWRCSQGHIWSATPGHVKQGTWCPECRKPVKLTLFGMQTIAHSYGGKCLARSLSNANASIEWECIQGHRFKTSAGNVNAGRWCAKCVNLAPLTIERLQSIAAARGGKCLSKKYSNNRSPISWQCGKKHRWDTSADSVVQGSWCPVCADQSRFGRNTERGTIEQMQAVAKSRGGECLSKRYGNNKTLLTWRCVVGHTWKAAPARVCFGTWCPYCSKRAPLTIAEMRRIARERGGRCLSKLYVNNSTPLIWRCAKKHEWKAKPVHVKNGTWCPECPHQPRPYI